MMNSAKNLRIGSPALKPLFAGFTLLVGLIFADMANAQSFGGAFEGMSNSKEPVQIEADIV